MMFRKMLVDYNDSDYLSLHNGTKYCHMFGDVWNGQVHCICNKLMLLARKLDAQFQQCYKTNQQIFLEEIPLLLPRLEEPKRCKRGIIGIMFKVIVNIASEVVSAFIKQWESNALCKDLLAM